jgi:hypothetical protein
MMMMIKIVKVRLWIEDKGSRIDDHDYDDNDDDNNGDDDNGEDYDDNNGEDDDGGDGDDEDDAGCTVLKTQYKH